MTGDNITSEQNTNIRFVKEVEKHPLLYNYELPEYTRKDISEAAWKDVGEAMNMTPSACRERWRNLRAVFTRSVRLSLKSSTGPKKPYYLSESLQFLVPFLRPGTAHEKKKQQEKEEWKRQVEQIKEEILDLDSDEYSEVSAEDIIEATATMKRPAQEEQLYHSMKVAKTIAQPSPSSSSMSHQYSDHVKSFLDSLLPELNEMNSAQFKQFKRRVLPLIDDIVSEIPATPRRRTNDEFI